LRRRIASRERERGVGRAKNIHDVDGRLSVAERDVDLSGDLLAGLP
jgi:hypothetical protein